MSGIAGVVFYKDMMGKREMLDRVQNEISEGSRCSVDVAKMGTFTRTQMPADDIRVRLWDARKKFSSRKSNKASEEFVPHIHQNFVVVHEGKIFNKETLEDQFEVGSCYEDTDLLVHLIAHFKSIDFIAANIEGSNNFAVADETSLWICRLGKPLYYYYTPDFFIFSSKSEVIRSYGAGEFPLQVPQGSGTIISTLPGMSPVELSFFNFKDLNGEGKNED